MAQVGVIGNIQAETAYMHSFGHLKSNTRYHSPADKIDMRSEGYLPEIYNRGKEAALKALNVSGMGAGTTDKAIVPIYLDKDIVDTSRKYTPATEIIPRVSNMGITADYVTVSKGGGFVAGEDSALAEVDNTYTRGSKAIKYLYAVGRVTGPTLAATPSFMVMGTQVSGGTPEGVFGSSSAPNATQLEVVLQTRAIKELEEDLIFNGDITSDANEFDGIVRLMSTTNAVVKGTTDLDLVDINTAVKNAFVDGGRPNVAFCDAATYTDVLNLLQAKVGYLQSEKQFFWGCTGVTLRTMVGEIPLIPSMFLSEASGSKSIYFLDLSVVELRVLQDLTYEKLAKTNDSDKFMLKEYCCLIIKNPSFCASVTGIK